MMKTVKKKYLIYLSKRRNSVCILSELKYKSKKIYDILYTILLRFLKIFDYIFLRLYLKSSVDQI